MIIWCYKLDYFTRDERYKNKCLCIKCSASRLCDRDTTDNPFLCDSYIQQCIFHLISCCVLLKQIFELLLFFLCSHVLPKRPLIACHKLANLSCVQNLINRWLMTFCSSRYNLLSSSDINRQGSIPDLNLLSLLVARKTTESWRWLQADMTTLLQPPVSGVFVCWILMALLVAMRDKTTGADGSWRFGVTAGEAKRCTHTTV